MREAKKSISFINDTALLNKRYRQPLIDALSGNGYNVISLGLFDSRSGLIKALFYMMAHGRGLFVSSNLRSNLVFLAIPWLQGLVILNGLGRYRQKQWLRRLLTILFHINSRKQVAIQSYADFRYFQRYAPSCSFIWVPGSGGQIKTLGPQGPIVTIQRDDKLPIVAPSLIQLVRSCEQEHPLIVVGCKDSAMVKSQLDDVPHVSLGYLPANEILSGGQTFAQPSGYGEGFPHSLADAIVSGMDIIIAPIEYRRYGLYKLQVVPDKRADSHIHFKSTQRLQDTLSAERITTKYIGLILP